MNEKMIGIFSKIFKILFIGFLIYRLLFNTNNINIIYVNKQIGLKGKITGINRARGYKIYIDSSGVIYNLDKFKNNSIIQNEGLGYYIDFNDIINKEPNSDTLLLIRKDKKSKWVYRP